MGPANYSLRKGKNRNAQESVEVKMPPRATAA